MYLLDSNIISELRKAPAGKANSGVVTWAQSNSARSYLWQCVTTLADRASTSFFSGKNTARR